MVDVVRDSRGIATRLGGQHFERSARGVQDALVKSRHQILVALEVPCASGQQQHVRWRVSHAWVYSDHRAGGALPLTKTPNPASGPADDAATSSSKPNARRCAAAISLAALHPAVPCARHHWCRGDSVGRGWTSRAMR